MQDSGSGPAPAPSPPSADSLLRHFPAEVRGAFTRLRETGDPAAADTVILAIVAEHMLNKQAVITDQSALIADLGFDSVAITEMVFFIEDLFQVSVSNAELLQIRTVGELRAFVREKLASRAVPPA